MAGAYPDRRNSPIHPVARRPRPHTRLPVSLFLPFATDTDAESDEDLKTNISLDFSSGDWQMPPQGRLDWTWSSRIRQVLPVGRWYWHLVPLAELMTKEWSFQFQDGTRQTGSISEFLE
ncbi:hypothetical protein, unlikely [Trypanosoma congolense IL3000]|uniref:Uncharacterized protein n=1 Tax=Trypanosoma congolense (strain IL3000) TaxID=1068625 RepID=F9W7L9_TRYCI|nr:hypothetical protein, unlikely [Trypanosoma congolense IL3000]